MPAVRAPAPFVSEALLGTWNPVLGTYPFADREVGTPSWFCENNAKHAPS